MLKSSINNHGLDGKSLVGVQCFNPLYLIYYVCVCLYVCVFDCSELNVTGEHEEDITKSKYIENALVIVTDRSIDF